MDAEVTALVGAERHGRSDDRTAYRNGTRIRTWDTWVGTVGLAIPAETVTAVEQARTRFTQKWQLRGPAVVESLKNASEELFTFLRFPPSQWKALRTTNALERIHEEFRRRTKTQASLPGRDAVLLLLFGLLRTSQVKLRALVGHRDMEAVKKAA